MNVKRLGGSDYTERKGVPYADDPNRPYDFGTKISIPCTVVEVNGRMTVVRLDPRDPNYHLVSGLRKAG